MNGFSYSIYYNKLSGFFMEDIQHFGGLADISLNLKIIKLTLEIYNAIVLRLYFR